MKKSSWPFIIFITVGMLFLLSFVFLRVHDFLIAYEETTISKFKICVMDNLIQSENASCGSSFPVGITKLYVCGYVDANYLKPGNFVNFAIYVDREKVDELIYRNQIGDEFTTGDFCRKIIIPDNSPRGSYDVKVYFYRKIVASSQFELK